jgi:SAM-dependent methyltransferase
LKIINEVVFDDLMRNQVTGKIIEVAPSGVSRSIFSPYGSNYESFDIDPSADGRDCDFIADLCEMPLANNSVTGFIALHVLEHISNDQQAFQEISRVMAPTGVCILQVPLAEYPQVTQEEFIKDDELRIQRYGQVDHVRLYGEDIIQRMQKNGLDGCFFSIEEMLPDFLMEILGLRDGAKFILATPNEYDLTKRDLNEIVSRLKNDFSRLEIFCELFKNEE